MLQGFSREFLAYLFAYDKRTGLFRRKVSCGSQPAGAVVGTVDGKGYLHVAVKRKFIRLHRLAFFLVTGDVPKYVDHKNHVKHDNRWCNLRACTQSQNAGNSGIHSHNTSGFRGVSKNSRTGMWHAQIKINGKQTYLGRFETPEEAARCYDRAAKKHFGATFAFTNYA